jgi:osmoprotectant transport system permease protein
MRLLTLFFFLFTGAAEARIVVGSKNFTESVILGELATLTLKDKGVKVSHRAQFGGTRILWNALLSGDVTVYPDYSGTVAEEILRRKVADLNELREALKELGIGVTGELGFNNTYALGMRRERAEELGVRTISDLARNTGLTFGFSEEFRNRQDGWPGLKERYNLAQRFVRGLDHDIAYRALATGDIDVTDLYSTDAEIALYDLLVLEDDLGYFPRYNAVYLYRLDQEQTVAPILNALAGLISDEKMVAMNRAAKLDKKSPGTVAAQFLRDELGETVIHRASTRRERLWVRSLEHLKLVSISLLLAILVAIPLGVSCCRCPRLAQVVLGIIGGVQTIPALALLVILIRPLNWVGLPGIGDVPALIALFLYSLLPIVRSTYAGFDQIALGHRETAAVLGLSPRTQLWRIEFPLALPMILAGIKTSAVLNVGFATLGALIGAGGYGQPILTGIRLDDYGLILEGAIPAVLLAFLSQQLFDLLERKLVSPGLRK